MARWFGLGRKQVLHEALDFVSRDENVAKQFAEKPTGCIAKPGRNRNDWAPDTNDARKFLDELPEGIGLGANGIDDAIRALGSLGDGEVGEIVNVDRLQAIFAPSEDSEDW